MGSLCASAFDSVSVGPRGPLITKLSVKNDFQQRTALDHKLGLGSNVKFFFFFFKEFFKMEDISFVICQTAKHFSL